MPADGPEPATAPSSATRWRPSTDPRLLRAALGPNVRPPVAILLRYHVRIDDTPGEYLGEATRHPLFELQETAEVS